MWWNVKYLFYSLVKLSMQTITACETSKCQLPSKKAIGKFKQMISFNNFWIVLNIDLDLQVKGYKILTCFICDIIAKIYLGIFSKILIKKVDMLSKHSSKNGSHFMISMYIFLWHTLFFSCFYENFRFVDKF